jgi:hypothetical protein
MLQMGSALSAVSRKISNLLQGNEISWFMPWAITKSLSSALEESVNMLEKRNSVQPGPCAQCMLCLSMQQEAPMHPF